MHVKTTYSPVDGSVAQWNNDQAAAVDAPKCQYEGVAQGQTPFCSFTWDIFIEIIWIVEVLMYPSTFLN